MQKADIWRWVERIILIGTILGMLYKYEVKDAVWKAEVKKDLEHLIDNDEKRENYWDNQLEFNGTVNEYIRSRSTEETQGD